MLQSRFTLGLISHLGISCLFCFFFTFACSCVENRFLALDVFAVNFVGTTVNEIYFMLKGTIFCCCRKELRVMAKFSCIYVSADQSWLVLWRECCSFIVLFRIEAFWNQHRRGPQWCILRKNPPFSTNHDSYLETSGISRYT